MAVQGATNGKAGLSGAKTGAGAMAGMCTFPYPAGPAARVNCGAPTISKYCVP